jgi:hypothetical protein
MTALAFRTMSANGCSNATLRAAGGRGYGLSIARELAERNGAALELSDRARDGIHDRAAGRRSRRRAGREGAPAATRGVIRGERGELDGSEAIRARFCFLFSGRPAGRLYQTGCLATAKDQLVKRAEARIFWARAEEADMVHMNLEVDIIPVTDVERSKQFYERLGWRLDDDVAPANDVHRPIHAPRVRVLGHVRQGNNCGCAWLGRGGADRLRHRGGP